MAVSDRPPRHELNRRERKFCNAFGFTKLYNFILWFIFSGAFLGFLLARAPYLNFDGIFCSLNPIPQLAAAPGECVSYYSRKLYKVGIMMHLCSIIPAGFLVLLQFFPVIRHKVILFHPINGYVIFILVAASHAGALIIAPVAFGGTLSTQLAVGVLVIITTISLLLAWINIKRLQIDQHRKWMLRAWFYFASIITERIVLVIAMIIISNAGTCYYAMPCQKIIGTMMRSGIPEQLVLTYYPTCEAFANGTNLRKHAVVAATVGASPESGAAVLDITFGMSLWMALVLHTVGIEVYLHLTPREHGCLRQVSYEKQVEAGMSHPGSSGLTADRLGDTNPFVPRLRGRDKDRFGTRNFLRPKRNIRTAAKWLLNTEATEREISYDHGGVVDIADCDGRRELSGVRREFHVSFADCGDSVASSFEIDNGMA